jgi:amphi-Trp domain-containing protein
VKRLKRLDVLTEPHIGEFRTATENKEMTLDLFKIDQTQHIRREDAAARLHALADALARSNSVEFERAGLRISVHVPDEVELKIEVEIGEDENELEIELTW